MWMCFQLIVGTTNLRSWKSVHILLYFEGQEGDRMPVEVCSLMWIDTYN
jgi:hypothetical protein